MPTWHSNLLVDLFDACHRFRCEKGTLELYLALGTLSSGGPRDRFRADGPDFQFSCLQNPQYHLYMPSEFLEVVLLANYQLIMWPRIA